MPAPWAARFEVHYTPKNTSWLNMVELELSAIARQCLHQCIPFKKLFKLSEQVGQY